MESTGGGARRWQRVRSVGGVGNRRKLKDAKTAHGVADRNCGYVSRSAPQLQSTRGGTTTLLGTNVLVI